ncbi:hypothetical protein GXW82_06545 [Streptacidiphilus sp. 4-A2]|nr:hypothetical protein [Streptacidiphilus sp. 4-A2]
MATVQRAPSGAPAVAAARVALASARPVSAAIGPTLLPSAPLAAPAQTRQSAPTAPAAPARSAVASARLRPVQTAPVAGPGAPGSASSGHGAPVVQRLSSAGPAVGSATPRPGAAAASAPRPGLPAGSAPRPPQLLPPQPPRPVQLSRLPAPQSTRTVSSAPMGAPVGFAPSPPAPPRPPAPAPAVRRPPRPQPAPVFPAVQRSGGSSPSSSSGTQSAEPHLDDLARRLVGPLSRLLRAELRLDRERIGRLRDPGR